MGDERSIDSEFGETAVAVAEASPNGTAEHGADSPESSSETASSDASDSTVAESSASQDAAADAPAGESPDFLTQLARAMQATAGAERGRATEEIDRRSSSHIASIRARAEAEALKMRDLAGDDRRAIERWAETEQERIKAERDRRTKELENDLTESLAEHGRQTDVQIQAVEAVVARHRTDVEAFFTSLDGETDPVRFAQRAGQRPAFPDLDRLSSPATSGSAEAPSVAAAPSAGGGTTPSGTTPAGTSSAAGEVTAEATAATQAPDADAAAATTETATEGGPADSGAVDPEPVPVMDPVARLGLLKHSPEPSPFAKPVGAAGGSSPTSAIGSATSTPIADRIAARPDEAKAVATPQPAHTGPMGWLRRNNDEK